MRRVWLAVVLLSASMGSARAQAGATCVAVAATKGKPAGAVYENTKYRFRFLFAGRLGGLFG
jgi:hypothetical protein